MKDKESGDALMLEPIEKVIQRCRDRIDRSFDCNIADIVRILDELENALKTSKNN